MSTDPGLRTLVARIIAPLAPLAPLARLAALAAALAPATVVAQPDCLDQAYVPTVNNGLEVTASQPVTQTFEVGITGQLTRVQFPFMNHHRGTPTQPLVFDLVTTDANGVPTTNVLANVTLPPAAVPPTRGPVSIDLRSFNVQVTRGQVLGLALSSNAMPSGQTYAWWGAVPGSYDRGVIFIRGNLRLDVWDLGFRTWVQHPAAWSNYGSGHPGTTGVPGLTMSANPVFGTTPNVLIGNSLGAVTAGALGAGFATDNRATPFGGTLLVQLVVTVPLGVPAGGAQVPTAMPSDTSLCGLSVFFQAFLADPGASLGIAFTPGMEMDLGT